MKGSATGSHESFGDGGAVWVYVTPEQDGVRWFGAILSKTVSGASGGLDSGCEKERETRAPVPPALDKAPRKALKVKASVRAKKAKKTKTE
jgi:hypothetical protein